MNRILWLRKHGPISYYFFKRYTFKYNVIHLRNYSQVVNNKSIESIVPLVTYPDAFFNKSIILKDTKNKVGIYR